ncbi:MAG TPA: RdgB/HAM1 family non-canonical purine NTP pyrophosphatase [Longimicrobiaceae bacterium]|nr:RdgB/HAM1 family non-canonical purine NTP pyrophosphatase [Longimicrobiaceae bacterium]
MRRLVVATRSAHKLREIREILGPLRGWEIVDLTGAGVPESPEEEGIEAYPTFRENALAKARYFVERTGTLTLADDSGLCVDALGGAPGVYSKRFAGRTDLSGIELDRTNNALLLDRLRSVARESRTGRYVCALALVAPDGAELCFEGSCEGSILDEPRGDAGFGYDPLFYLPAEHATFGELAPERKNEISHRAVAVRAAREALTARHAVSAPGR